MRTRLYMYVFIVLTPAASAQTLVIPQIADGNGWQTELVLTNTGATATTVSLSFFQSTANGVTQSWTPAFLETSVLQNIPVPAASTVFLHTPGTAASLSEGWAQLQTGPAVSAYAIFTETVPGRQNQDGTALAAPSVSRMLVPFENTNGFVTSIAIVNTTGAPESVAVAMQPGSGAAAQLPRSRCRPMGTSRSRCPSNFPRRRPETACSSSMPQPEFLADRAALQSDGSIHRVARVCGNRIAGDLHRGGFGVQRNLPRDVHGDRTIGDGDGDDQ